MQMDANAKAHPSAKGRQRRKKDESFIVLTMPEEKVYGERTRGRTLDRVGNLLGNGYPTMRGG
jgi:hypothetical protein